MKALIFSEGNGYGHVARNKIISEHFGIPIMTFGKGAEYCKNSSMDFIEIPTPYVIKTGSGRVRIRPDISELAGFLKHDAMVSLKDQFSKVDFVIVDGSPLALALAMLAGKKSIYITNDTSSLVGVYGLIQKKIAGSLSNKIINSANSILIPDFPPPLTITMSNLNYCFPMQFIGPLSKKEKQIKHDKKYLVVGTLEKKLRPILGNSAIYGSDVEDLRSYYEHSDIVICHGGHTTIMEAISYGKPVICIIDNTYAERSNNAQMLQQIGIGLCLDEKLVNKNSILSSIDYIGTLDKKRLNLYKKTAKRLDPLKALESAISDLTN